MAIERHPDVAKAMVEAGHEICSHGYRWIDYQYIDESEERDHMTKAIEIIQQVTGQRPQGWYTGRTGPNTRRLVAEEGGFLYDSDAYDDDLPYWHTETGHPQLVIPYTLDVNDMRFSTAQGFNSGEQFFQYLKDTFDTLYMEARPGRESLPAVRRGTGQPAAAGRRMRACRTWPRSGSKCRRRTAAGPRDSGTSSAASRRRAG